MGLPLNYEFFPFRQYQLTCQIISIKLLQLKCTLPDEVNTRQNENEAGNGAQYHAQEEHNARDVRHFGSSVSTPVTFFLLFARNLWS